MKNNRKSGVLLHLSSLPNRFGIGDMGFGVDILLQFLRDAGFRAWQILPLFPTEAVFGESPYSCPSSFAGNTLFISPDLLVEEGLLESSECAAFDAPSENHVDFEKARRIRKALLGSAYRRFCLNKKYHLTMHAEFDAFVNAESYWLDDYALFLILKEKFSNVCWNQWPEEYRIRDPLAIHTILNDPQALDKINRIRFDQFLFFSQLKRLRTLCAQKEVELIGDLPIYVAFDSADVWSHQELFSLDGLGNPITVAGVPPDYFSATGQRWGNPLYRWDMMEKDSFDWWKRRFRQALRGCDLLRVDHFRAFCGYWEIPANETTAVNGWWTPAPGRSFFDSLEDLRDREGLFPFIAEDLGIITPDVRSLMDDLQIPGMKILQFAFGENMEQNPYIPHFHQCHSVVYTGTHDNNTTLAWWEDDATATEKQNFLRYMGRGMITDDEVLSLMVRCALGSVAERAIIPMQDILALRGDARMNRPSMPSGYWSWCLKAENLKPALSRKYRELNTLYARCTG